MDAAFYTPTPLTAEEVVEHDRVLGALAAATRALGDAQLRTRVSLAEAAAATREIEELTRRLLSDAIEGAHGTTIGPGPDEMRYVGNTVVGLRSPLGPVDLERDRTTDGQRVTYHLWLGAVYEGPPGLVHGGVSALILDQVLGDAAALAGGPGMTGRLTVHYRRPTPLGRVVFEGWTDRTEGRKTIALGTVKDADGNVTIEAEGLFITPRWVVDSDEWARRKQTLE